MIKIFNVDGSLLKEVETKEELNNLLKGIPLFSGVVEFEEDIKYYILGKQVTENYYYEMI